MVTITWCDCAGCPMGSEDPTFCYGGGCPGFELVTHTARVTEAEAARLIAESPTVYRIVEEEREELIACAVCGASRRPDAPCACGFF